MRNSKQFYIKTKKSNNNEAILFDMIGVLLFQKETYKPNKIVDEIDFQIGQVIDDNLFKQKILKEYNFDDEEFKNILKKIVNKYEPFKELWNIIPELKKKYKIAVINNGTALTLPLFEKKYNFNKNFDIFVSSAKEGIKKPNKNIFLLTCQRLNVDPRNCLFMDDSLENIKGAQKAEMKTIHWKNKNDGFQAFTKFIR